MHDEGLRVLPRLVERFEIDRHILIGHSDGGSIAIIYAGSGPAALAGLILEAPHVFVEDLTIASIREARLRYATADLRQRLARYHDHPDRMFESWAAVWLSPEFRGWSIEEYLPAVRCPTLLIQGEDDEYGTLKQVGALAAGMAGEHETLMLPACGHAPHVDQRAAVEEASVAFVARVLA
jgi:pimeloyl-ACP methyl ester carboxylesterase